MGVNVRVVLGDNENFEKALRRFKKACDKAGIKKECRERERYQKPSDARRQEIRKAERNRKQLERQSKKQSGRQK